VGINYRLATIKYFFNIKKMQKIKIGIRVLIFSLVAILCFSPFAWKKIFRIQAVEFVEITEDTVWSEDKVVDGMISISDGSTLTIEKGVEILFKKNSRIIVERGLFLVRGTKKEPVLFDSEDEESGYSVMINSGGGGDIRNADIKNGGNVVSLIANNSLMQSAYGAEYIGAISVYNGGWLQVEGCSFYNNKVAVSLKNAYGDRVSVSRSSFYDNSQYDVYNNSSISKGEAIFDYNWWDSSSGPKEDKISGSIRFDYWAKSGDFKDPVIIIPGILGSQKKDGQWQVDLIFHTYDNFYNAFVKDGYVPELDLFTFPYEWRDSNIENAELLASKIEEIKEIANWPKVDIVAHSMGGILSREYIESDYYQEDVDQLITLGTPHLGAPKSYLSYESGNFSLGYTNILTRYVFKQEAEEGGYDNLFDYIHGRPIDSIQELLPVYDYIFDKDTEMTRTYPDNYPQNEFLENLNSLEMTEKLRKVEFSKIVGSVGGSESTLSGFNVINEDFGEYWEHGYPQGIEVYPLSKNGVIFDYGDETVPLISAKSEDIFSDYLIELESSHGGLSTDAQKDVLELLTGERPVEEVRNSLVENILIVSVYSPVDVQVIDPDGKVIGKDFEMGEAVNEIEGAYYTGFDTENEFVTIPNPKDGEYKIRTQGTGNGNYRIESVLISENDENPLGADESMVVFEGETQVGQIEEGSVDVSGNEVLEKESDIIPPTISISSPEDQDYLNTGNLEISFNVEDNVSITENILQEIKLDNEIFTEEELELPMMLLGEHELKVTAKDMAENEAVETVTFNLKTNIESLIENIDYYYDNDLIDKKSTKRFIENHLRQIKKLIDHKEKVLNHFKFHRKYKKRLERVFDRIINKRIDLLIKHLNRQSEKEKINFFVIERLIEGLEHVRQ